MSDTLGVYRSEKYVVVERHRHLFPARCIWCNGAVDNSDAAVTSIGGGAPLRPPVCATCAATRNRLPLVVSILGVTAVLAALLLYFTGNALLAAIFGAGGLIDLVVAWRLRAAARGFRAAREDEQYVWIAGADKRFLAALPPWTGMTLGELLARNR